VLPDFTVRQVVTTVNVWDNQTVVLGGLISSQVLETKDKVPVLGDVPFVGRLFQSQSKSTVKKNLMIFVTATIVDPAGNRVHSDDELPFAQTAIPNQPVVPGQTFIPGPMK
jgi:general secretion pathway protein D